jgi:hypothetical protein
MLNTVQGDIVAVFNGFLDLMGHAALSLFYISFLASLPFVLFAIIKAMNSGGGASLIYAIGWKIFVLTGCLAVVEAWPALARGVSADITAFAQTIANHNGIGAVDFTPDGVVLTNFRLIALLYGNGFGAGLAVLDMMNLWKLVSIGLAMIAGALLALELLLANISLAMVFGGLSFLIGFMLNPWMSFFSEAVIKLVGAAGVFIVLISVFVAAGETFAGTAVTSPAIHVVPNNPISGVDMLIVPVFELIFAVLAAIVPAAAASAICGGKPIATLGTIVSSARMFR